MAIQAAQIHDISAMSRAGSRAQRAYAPTLSYPQRIAVLLADAPEPPALHRAHVPALPPLGDETRASLIAVHTLNTTFG